ncbi:MAG TPA: hypothetical protein VG897_02405, partial [Terriglobales bacterium]|nr:hypothetical protein [Terriglobales bacterium]
NADISKLVARSGLQLISGEPSELCGFSSFDPQAIAARRSQFFCVNDVLTQCIVLQKPKESAGRIS